MGTVERDGMAMWSRREMGICERGVVGGVFERGRGEIGGYG